MIPANYIKVPSTSNHKFLIGNNCAFGQTFNFSFFATNHSKHSESFRNCALISLAHCFLKTKNKCLLTMWQRKCYAINSNLIPKKYIQTDLKGFLNVTLKIACSVFRIVRITMKKKEEEDLLRFYIVFVWFPQRILLLSKAAHTYRHKIHTESGQVEKWSTEIIGICWCFNSFWIYMAVCMNRLFPVIAACSLCRIFSNFLFSFSFSGCSGDLNEWQR